LRICAGVCRGRTGSGEVGKGAEEKGKTRVSWLREPIEQGKRSMYQAVFVALSEDRSWKVESGLSSDEVENLVPIPNQRSLSLLRQMEIKVGCVSPVLQENR
jgi:hypothetical protein